MITRRIFTAALAALGMAAALAAPAAAQDAYPVTFTHADAFTFSPGATATGLLVKYDRVASGASMHAATLPPWASETVLNFGSTPMTVLVHSAGRSP